MIMDFDISVRKMSVTKNLWVSFYFSHGNYFMCQGTGKMLEFQKLKKQDSIIYNTVYHAGSNRHFLLSAYHFFNFCKSSSFLVLLRIK